MIFGPRVEGCTARPIKSDRTAICVKDLSSQFWVCRTLVLRREERGYKFSLKNLSASSQRGNAVGSLELEMVSIGLSSTKPSVCCCFVAKQGEYLS